MLQINLFSKEAKKAQKTHDCPPVGAQELQYPMLSLDVSVLNKIPVRQGPRHMAAEINEEANLFLHCISSATISL